MTISLFISFNPPIPAHAYEPNLYQLMDEVKITHLYPHLKIQDWVLKGLNELKRIFQNMDRYKEYKDLLERLNDFIEKENLSELMAEAGFF